MIPRKQYDSARSKIHGYLLSEKEFEGLSDVEMASILSELSAGYLKYEVLSEWKKRSAKEKSN